VTTRELVCALFRACISAFGVGKLYDGIALRGLLDDTDEIPSIGAEGHPSSSPPAIQRRGKKDGFSGDFSRTLRKTSAFCETAKKSKWCPEEDSNLHGVTR
jgi:hypothetical protein